MPLIKNPQYSRPIDVHRWSDHPEVKQLVEEVWEDWLPEAFTEKEARVGAKPGPKAKASDKQQLRVLILDLINAPGKAPDDVRVGGHRTFAALPRNVSSADSDLCKVASIRSRDERARLMADVHPSH